MAVNKRVKNSPLLLLKYLAPPHSSTCLLKLQFHFFNFPVHNSRKRSSEWKEQRGRSWRPCTGRTHIYTKIQNKKNTKIKVSLSSYKVLTNHIHTRLVHTLQHDSIYSTLITYCRMQHGSSNRKQPATTTPTVNLGYSCNWDIQLYTNNCISTASKPTHVSAISKTPKMPTNYVALIDRLQCVKGVPIPPLPAVI